MTDKAEFIEQVERHLPPGLTYPSDYIEEVVSALADIGYVNYSYPRQHIAKAIQLLPRLHVLQKSRPNDTVTEGKLTAHALLTADHLAAYIKPRLVAIRKEYFDCGDAPFATLQEAEQWMDVYDSGTFVLELEAAKEWERVFKATSRNPNWEYIPGQSGERWCLMTSSFWRWDSVMEEILGLSDETGISPDSLKAFLLADIKPLALPYEITMPGSEYCKGRRKCHYVNIKVNTELGFDDLFAIYRTVKNALGVKKGKRLDQQHLELYTLVQEQGDPPHKGAVKFWESILEEWNNRHPGDYKEWRSIRRAYDRLSTKLNAQYQISEVTSEGSDLLSSKHRGPRKGRNKPRKSA